MDTIICNLILLVTPDTCSRTSIPFFKPFVQDILPVARRHVNNNRRSTRFANNDFSRVRECKIAIVCPNALVIKRAEIQHEGTLCIELQSKRSP